LAELLKTLKLLVDDVGGIFSLSHNVDLLEPYCLTLTTRELAVIFKHVTTTLYRGYRKSNDFHESSLSCFSSFICKSVHDVSL